MVLSWKVTADGRLDPEAVAPKEYPCPSGWAAFSPDGRRAAMSPVETGLWLWDATRGKCLGVVDGFGVCTAVVFSPDGRTLAAGEESAVLSVVDVSAGPGTGRRRVRLDGHQRSVRAVAFRPDGQMLASAGDDHVVVLRDLPTGAGAPARGEGHTESILSLAFSPDGRTLASGSEDESVRLWDAEKGRCRAILPCKGPVKTLAFAPDGKTLAAGIEKDGAVRLWEVATGQERAVLLGHMGPITALAFRPDSRILASGSADATILLWDLGRPPQPPATKEEELLWADLTGDNAASAFQAFGALSRDPGHAVALLQRHLRPATAPDAGRLARLMAQLDSDQFPDREKASRELQDLGHLAEPALRRLLAKPPSPEAQPPGLAPAGGPGNQRGPPGEAVGGTAGDGSPGTSGYAGGSGPAAHARRSRRGGLADPRVPGVPATARRACAVRHSGPAHRFPGQRRSPVTSPTRQRGDALTSPTRQRGDTRSAKGTIPLLARRACET